MLRSGQLAGQKRLNLSCGLTEFPLEILDLADSLEILDLSNNHLSTLPEAFGQLSKLKAVFFTNNAFEEFPAVLSTCPALSMISFKGNQLKTIGEQILSPIVRWLILTDNQLETLPADIGKLSKLQKCMLAGNRLRSVPDELANCHNLELIRLSANCLETLPKHLLDLPRLSWLAYAGNPFCEGLGESGAISGRSLPLIDIDELQLGDVLGQGASGVIYKALWKPQSTDSASPQEVAIKLFKGDITSDGLPLDEMQACIAAGSHPHLVTVLGKLNHTLEGKTGLVFSFIPADHEKLGNPPSLETCSRDTYSDDTSFTLPVIVQIARSIASAAMHLHANGVMHGDLYAHNTLVNKTGEAILSDLGAASFYDATDTATGQALERLEVRAFGCLLEDLLDRYAPTGETQEEDATRLPRLRHLQQDCMQPSPALRPLFTDIHEALASPNNFLK
ncbi:MAG: leucine-rich repeat-containing protein kinase family protein [Cyanobacteria bacterium J06626_18]